MAGHISILIMTLSIALSASGQIITGVVVDSKTLEPLPFANVYLNNTTIGTVTDMQGKFILKQLPTGSFDLIVSFVGYQSNRQSLTIGSTDLDIGSTKLLPDEQELASVVVKGTRDKEWEQQLNRFKRTFLGLGRDAKACKITNPWVIEFDSETLNRKLSARSTSPIEIENLWLGYNLYYDLTDFWVVGNMLTGEMESVFSFRGYTRFEELKARDEAQAALWKRHRDQSYRESYNYFFESILDHRISGHGFTIYKEDKENDSGSGANAHKVRVRLDTTEFTPLPDAWNNHQIVLNGLVEVSNKSKLFRRSSSQIKIKGDTIHVNKMGFPLNPEDIVVYGDWNDQRVGSLLPADFGNEKPLAPTVSTFSRKNKLLVPLNNVLWYEQLYLMTDKPYYYPGEPLWFKGFVQYASRQIRDSLSSSVYVELISSKDNIVQTRTVEIDSGFFFNDFVIPDSLISGNYYLRAYTNLSRNFGVAGEFIKQISILSITDRADPSQEAIEVLTDSAINILSDKLKYKKRDHIALTLSVRDMYGNPVSANLAISVTDVRQVVPIRDRNTINSEFIRNDSFNIKDLQLQFPVERGLNFSGEFRNKKGNLQFTSLNVMQWNPLSYMLIDTDSTGRFSLKGISFRDTMTFSFKPINSKNNLTGSVRFFPREIPRFIQPNETDPIKILATNTPQRFISEYEVPKDSKLLEEIVVKAKRIDPYEKVRLHANYVFDAKDFPNQSQDLMTALMGRVPGLSIQQAGANKVSQSFESLIEITEPVVTYFKKPIGLGPGIKLVSDVESVLFFRGTTYRAAQMIIIPKSGSPNSPPAPNFQSVKLIGYSSPTTFSAPDYSLATTDTGRVDYRATLYWNPTISTSPGSGRALVSFWSADISTTYRIVVEGVTQNGVPVRGVKFIEVDND